MLDSKGFDKWAGNYDESISADHNTFPFDGYYDVLSAVFSFIDPQKDMRILDVGIGTGLLSEALSKKGCIIHGVDFSERMLEKARIRIPNGQFETTDVLANHFGKFNNYQYDRIVSSYFFHHFNLDQKTAFLIRTLEHNLSPNGKIIIADIGFENESGYQACLTRHKDNWDYDEFYLCGESLIFHLYSEGIKAEYRQITSCAGILVC